jgi:hypothetical protein
MIYLAALVLALVLQLDKAAAVLALGLLKITDRITKQRT